MNGWLARRRRRPMCLLMFVVCGVGVASAGQQPRRATSLSGTDWTSFSAKDKQLYLSGFIAGAAAEEARGKAIAARRTDDSSAVSSAAIEMMRKQDGLHFRFASTVYMAQLDDFYWWANHASVPVLDAMVSINQRMLMQYSTGAP